MHFHPFEVSTPHIVYACLGGFVVFFGMFSLFIREKLYIGEACWAFLFGVIIGPYGAGIFDPRSWGNSIETTNTITLEFSRVVLAIGVFAIGVELPKKYMYRHWKSLLFLLFPVMTWGWFVSAGLIYALIPHLNFLSSLAIAACLTPTDPILAAAVVGGKYADKHVPAHLRHLLAAESGCNDGAAFPFLYIALYLTLDRTTGEAVKDWFLILWLYEVVLGIIWGSMLGYGFRHLMKFCERKDLIDRQSYVAQYVSLALLTIGTTTLLGSDDLLAAFACGTAFAWDGFFNKQTEASVFSSVIDLLFNVAAFVFVGAWTPFNAFSDPVTSLSVGRLISIAILVLLLRRLPALIALYKWIPDIKSFREALFSGHFGPMGIGAVFISTLAAETLPRPQNPPANQAELLAATIQPIVAFMVVCSILIHGLSIPFFSLGRRVTTVTRTWSRQPSLPEWQMHTRRVDRAEDVVINRDPANVMERGEAEAASEKERMTDRSSDTADTTGTVDEKREHHEHNHRDSPQREDSAETDAGTVAAQESDGRGDAEGDAPDEAKADNAPDGAEVLAEWKEGPHRIIERRMGPGEEVEVEVQRNAYGPGDGDRITRAFHGGHAAVHRAADAFVGGVMRHVPHEVERHLPHLPHPHARAHRSRSPHPHPHPHPWEEGVVVHAPEPTPLAPAPAAEDDEAWASEPEEDPPTPAELDAPATEPPLPTDSLSQLPAGSSSERRRPRPRHRRLASLKGSARGSREASPARSVRWADEAPRSAGMSPAGSRAPSPSPEREEGDSPGGSVSEARGRAVTFDLARRA
ncbi:Sodium/hydrogen exchanger family-domain-containing protein [Gloeopeniophorella convolvens]|nr:Sodium/hydrogen exchanger family-domain-containing protein [Gloeopeniophorella convolvens]